MTRAQNMIKCKRLWIVLGAIFTVVILLCGGFFLYVSDYYHAGDYAIQAMGTVDEIQVDTTSKNAVVYTPSAPRAGLIFYPGGKVEYTAYSPLMRACAEQGILCVLLEMPYNLAVFNINAADGIAEQYPEIETWFIGGHSLGGAMAAAYAADHSESLNGVILLAAYSIKDLKDSNLAVLSVYGSEDQVLDKVKYAKYRENLPDDTVETVIDGGCHAGFGNYGVQEGDGIPAITSEEQIRQTSEEIAETVLKICRASSSEIQK